MINNEYSSYDSEQEDDQVNPMYLGKVMSHGLAKSTDFFVNNVPKTSLNNDELDDDDQGLLQPKMKVKKQKQQINILNNPSTITTKTQVSKIPRRPLTAAYTFKLPPSQTKRKKHDPVSLFQQTSQAWKKDKFLTSRANNKQGRKLDLQKRNRYSKTIETA